MPDARTLAALLQLASPALPVGAYSYSQGLERAIHDGDVVAEADVAAWITDVVAGPLAVVVGGFATPEARLKDLLIMGFALTAFCMVLFGDILNLPIPVFPNALLDAFPAGWSQKAILRLTAGVLVGLAVAVFFILPGRPRTSEAEIVESSGRV